VGKKKCIFPVGVAEDLGEEAAASIVSKPKSLASKILSPIKSLRKRKTEDLSPEAKTREEGSSSSSKVRRRGSSSDESVQVVQPPYASTQSQASIYGAMPPPSMISRSSNVSFSNQSAADDFEVQMLRQQLHESQEDLTLSRRRWEAREALYQSQIAGLKLRLERGEGSSMK
jgi:hypothetical protein